MVQKDIEYTVTLSIARANFLSPSLRHSVTAANVHWQNQFGRINLHVVASNSPAEAEPTEANARHSREAHTQSTPAQATRG
jgi:hypothetical protein